MSARRELSLSVDSGSIEPCGSDATEGGLGRSEDNRG